MFYTPISYSQTDSDQFVRDNKTNENFGDTNGDGVVDALDEATTEADTATTDTTTTDASSADEIQMDTNGDGVVDALDEATTEATDADTNAATTGNHSNSKNDII